MKIMEIVKAMNIVKGKKKKRRKKRMKKRVRQRKRIQGNERISWNKILSKIKMPQLNSYRLGALLCGMVLICALAFISRYYMLQERSEEVYEELRSERWSFHTVLPNIPVGEEETQEEVLEVEEEETSVDASLRRKNNVDFQELYQLNEDIYAWIEIPGTKVDYPILQHPTDDAYYLNHTVEKAAGLPGSIYSEGLHPKDFSAAQTVLYGHNMKNDTMFGSLHDYEDKQAFEEFPYIYIYLPDKTLLYQIFAAVRFSDAYLPSYCDYTVEEDFLGFVEEIREAQGNVNQELEIPFESRLLTLSTCIANDPTHRFLVEAVLIGEYENEREE